MKLTASALNAMKESIKGELSHAQYRAGNTWKDIDIEKVSILSDGRLAVYVYFDENCPNKITGLRLYNRAGEIWAQGDVALDKTSYPEGMRYRLALTIKQEEIAG